ncbi:probable prolyl 4-hydroxylase 10 isoform X2 [Vigna angularis]|uniref:probable prolyl 4-hydroxylase 10 isoform X2 n=1 Tax=Phaseolus angularis TaxID=3914 RepID=UPI0022B42FFA|nr:probable prolyl 4-hydroxylase 10 isoform X2 [Vigna angularis]
MVKARHSRVQKSWMTRWSWMFLLSVLTMFMFLLILLLLALHLRMPNTNTSFAPFEHNHLNSIARNASYISEGEDEQGEQWVEILSWEPRAFLYHNFLTKEECEYLINIAKPNMQKSSVLKSGKPTISSARTSFGTFLDRGLDKTVRNIEKRIADFTHIPVENGEGLQILHYEVGQEYVAHPDFFGDELYTANGGNRIATMLMYLSDVEEGGETVFPDAKGNSRSVPWWNINKLSYCAKKGLSIKPKMGNALLFWNMRPDATYDPSSVHAICFD